ncbi:MAG: carbohydrate-binding family 9-like protein [Victivallaceae bacterium]
MKIKIAEYYLLIMFAINSVQAQSKYSSLTHGWKAPSPEIKVKRSCNCYRLGKRPELDGMVKNDPVWRGVPKTKGFVDLKVRGNNTLAKKQTLFQIGYTNEALYIAVICEEPEISLLKPGKEAIWANDCIEIFLLPENAYGWYRHLAVSPWGEKFTETKGVPDTGAQLNVHKWWTAKSYCGSDFWSAEIEIPYSLLWEFPGKDNIWYANICRSRYAGSRTPEHSSWAYLVNRFHEPENFARLCFMDEVDLKCVGYLKGDEGKLYIKKCIDDNLHLLKDSLELVARTKNKYNDDSKLKETETLLTKINREISLLPTVNSVDSVPMAELLYILHKTEMAVKIAEELKQKILEIKLINIGE